jgi:hypothetical protein
MNNFIQSLPRNVLAFLAIAGGIALIVINSPPHTVCESQVEIVKKLQKKFLYKDDKSKIKTTKYERLRDTCKGSNNPGGCYEYFAELKNLLHDLGTMPSDCSGSINSIGPVKSALWESAELLVQLAWGEKPPTSYQGKFGWLEVADISLFCQLKSRIISFYGDPAWNSFREKISVELPGAQPMTRNQIWDMSLFSENCARYP